MNRTENPEINLHLCDQLVLTRVLRPLTRGKKSLWPIVQREMNVHMPKSDIYPDLTPYTKFNSTNHLIDRYNFYALYVPVKNKFNFLQYWRWTPEVLYHLNYIPSPCSTTPRPFVLFWDRVSLSCQTQPRIWPSAPTSWVAVCHHAQLHFFLNGPHHSLILIPHEIFMRVKMESPFHFRCLVPRTGSNFRLVLNYL